jgi:transposase
MMAIAVLDDHRSVTAVAGRYRCGWHTVHNEVVASPMKLWAPTQHRFGCWASRRPAAAKPSGSMTQLPVGRVWVDRWDTGLVDISGDQGLLGQVNGRNSAVVIDWLAARDDTWTSAITHVAIDLSTAYARVARQALPHAIVIADRFHLVKKANEMVECGAPSGHLDSPGSAWPQDRRRVDQPAPAAACWATAHRRATQYAVDQAAHR